MLTMERHLEIAIAPVTWAPGHVSMPQVQLLLKVRLGVSLYLYIQFR